jgi:hypothetical protein
MSDDHGAITTTDAGIPARSDSLARFLGRIGKRTREGAMNGVALLLAFLASSTASASTKLLLLEDIGTEEARFSWDGVYGGEVALSAIVDRPNCWDEAVADQCYDFHSTGALKGFKRQSRDVYYVGNGDAAPVLCGKAPGFFERPRFYDTCRVSVEPERVCEAWYTADDCVRSVTRYRVYLSIDGRDKLASEGGASRSLFEGF